MVLIQFRRFSPLAGCGLFHLRKVSRAPHRSVSVPLRGVGCFNKTRRIYNVHKSFSPLAGCGLFLAIARRQKVRTAVFQSPCGVWVVSKHKKNNRLNLLVFQSPCGVWVVSEDGTIVMGVATLFQSPCGVWVVSVRCVSSHQ